MSLLTESVPYEEAARIVADKQIMSKEAFDALCDELKARAFVVTGLEDLRAVQEIRDAIAELPRGAAWEDVKAQVIEKLEAGGFSQAAGDYRATLLLRHHGFAAYAQENYRELREMQDVFPYWKYQSMGDEKVRSSHAALDGLILPADDPFWRTHFPPWEWNCRCMVVGVTEEEYGSAKTVGSFDATDPDAKAGGWKLTPALRERLRQGQLDDGSGHPVMVTRTGSLHFDPSGPGLDMAEIEKRYNPGDWANFRERMEAEKLADGRSVWDWATGKTHAETQRRGEGSGGAASSRAPAGGPPALPGETGRTATPRQDGDGAEKVWEAPAVQTGMQNAAREALKESQKTGVEVAALVDYQTGERFGELVKGTRTEVDARPLVKAAKDSGRTIAIVHTHPDGGVPSKMDLLRMFVSSETIRRMDVVEPDGTLHVLRIGATWEAADKKTRRLVRLTLRRSWEEQAYEQWETTLLKLAKEGYVDYEKNAD